MWVIPQRRFVRRVQAVSATLTIFRLATRDGGGMIKALLRRGCQRLGDRSVSNPTQISWHARAKPLVLVRQPIPASLVPSTSGRMLYC